MHINDAIGTKQKLTL